MKVTDDYVENLNRIISLINHIDKVVADDEMLSIDRLSLVYNTVQIIKIPLQEIMEETEKEDDHIVGFKVDKEE